MTKMMMMVWRGDYTVIAEGKLGVQTFLFVSFCQRVNSDGRHLEVQKDAQTHPSIHN